MDENFSRQTRRFSAAIVTYGKGNRRSMAGIRPARQRATVVNTGSYTYIRTSVRFRTTGLMLPQLPAACTNGNS